MTATITITCPECKKQLKGPAELQGKQIRCKNCGATFTVRATTAARPPTAPRPAQAKSAPTQPPKTTNPKAPAKPATVDEEEDANPYTFMDDEAARNSVSKANTPAKPAEPKPAVPKLAGEDEDDANPYGVTETDLTPRCPYCTEEMESEEAVVCLHCGYNTRTRTLGKTKVMHHISGAERFRWLLPGILCVLSILGLIGFCIWFIFGLQSYWNDIDAMIGNGSFTMGLRIWALITSLGIMWGCGRYAFKRLVLEPSPPEVEKK